MMAKRYVLTSNTSPTTGISGRTHIVPSGAGFPISPSASAGLSNARPGGKLPPAWGGGRGWGNTRAQPRDPSGQDVLDAIANWRD